MSCDVGEVTEMLENEQSYFSSPSVPSPASQFILLPLFRFSYATSSSLNSLDEPPMRERENKPRTSSSKEITEGLPYSSAEEN